MTPIWTEIPENARRVRQRMRTVFQWAMAHGYLDYNLAEEGVDGALPPMPKVKNHIRALPYRQVAEALRIVDSGPSNVVTKLAFRFLVLTAARSIEVRGALWPEIDLERREIMRVLRLPDVLARVSLSKSTLWRLINDGEFPKPIRLGPRATGWIEEEFDEWIASRSRATNRE